MSNEHGTKELEELLDGLFLLIEKSVPKFKDGFQPRDISELALDKDIHEAIEKAAEDIGDLKLELGDLEATEIASLLMKYVFKVPALIDLFKDDK